MITQRTKVQLLIFVFITLIGVSFVGARYARLDRLVLDRSYDVVAHFKESGGIFTGAEVSYRGVTIGRVGQLELRDDGVDVHLDIDNGGEPIPADTMALVGNRSAVGEQYVELQPETSDGPYLKDGSEIPTEMTATPISASTLLLDLDNTVNSVNQQSLRTVVSEMGKAFSGTGEDLGQIIDTSNSFIKTANDNFDVTSALIRDSNTVLHGQIDSASAIRSFAKDLSLFTGTLAGSDKDLRAVIDNGGATASQLRRFLENNQVDLGQLINNLVTTGDIVVKHLDGVRQVLVLYPYVVAGGYTVVAKDPQTGLYDAHFGMVTTHDPPVCHNGYTTKPRPPQDTSDKPMDMNARCTEPPTQSNARGSQNKPRAGTAYRSPVVATYDVSTGKLRYTDRSPHSRISYTGGASEIFGEESWKWLLLQPLADSEE